MAAARWCARVGARVSLADTRTEPAGLNALRNELGAAIDHVWLGPDALDAVALTDLDMLVLSPGLAPFQDPLQVFLQNAQTQGVQIVGEIELFARALADLAGQGYRPRVLAVTGTNGKTTVTALTRHLVQAHGLVATAAGNISPAALHALGKALDQNALPDVWVLELSSFQLHTLESLRADAAVVLNVTQDHLDWHGSMQAYADAKAKLLHMAQVAIVNRNDPLVLNMVRNLQDVNVRSFGRDLSEFEGDLGLEHDHGMTWLVASESPDFETPVERTPRGRKQQALLRMEGRLTRLMPAEALHLRGQHNALNALAALALVRSIGLSWASSLNGLREYRGEPHRTEFVRNIAGVDFVNDSKGTNVGATVAALDGMGRPVVLIAGGLGKGQDFTPLAQSACAHARAVVLIGQDAPLIENALRQQSGSLVIDKAVDMAGAVQQAFSLARPGDTVLLSPACASMDMFRNYGHRGQSFVDQVNELALQNGEVA
jgi:UDP-N-acetylmuramoylalanine--D-glutamate ligase